MSPIHEDNLLLYFIPHASVCGCILLSNVLHVHWKLGCVYLAIAIQLCCSFRWINRLGMVFNVVNSNQLCNFILFGRDFNDIILHDMLPLYRCALRSFWFVCSFSWCGRYTIWSGNRFSQEDEITSENQWIHCWSCEASCRNFRVSVLALWMAQEWDVLIFRIFKMMSDINSGGIFWLLPLNAIFMAVSMYNMEHVNINSFYREKELSKYWSPLKFDTVNIRHCYGCIQYVLLDLFIDLANIILLFCNCGFHSAFIDCDSRIWYELVQLSR